MMPEVVVLLMVGMMTGLRDNMIHMYTQQIRVIYNMEGDNLSKLVRDREILSTKVEVAGVEVTMLKELEPGYGMDLERRC